MKVCLTRVESKCALNFGEDSPLWFVHGSTAGGIRYVFKHLFESSYAADKAVDRMTDGNGQCIVQLASKWAKTYQRTS